MPDEDNDNTQDSTAQDEDANVQGQDSTDASSGGDGASGDADSAAQGSADQAGAAGTTDGEGGDSEASGDGSAQTPQLTGEDVLQLLSSEEAQEYVRGQFAQWQADQEAQAQSEEARAEISELVKNGDFEELGKRFAQEYGTAEVRAKVASEAQAQAYAGVYRSLLAEPELQELTPEEQGALAIQRFTVNGAPDYARHTEAIRTFITEKRVDSAANERVEAKVKETLEALANMQAGNKNTNLGTPTIPGGDGSKDTSQMTGRDLLAAGLAEEMEKAGYQASED